MHSRFPLDCTTAKRSNQTLHQEYLAERCVDWVTNLQFAAPTTQLHFRTAGHNDQSISDPLEAGSGSSETDEQRVENACLGEPLGTQDATVARTARNLVALVTTPSMLQWGPEPSPERGYLGLR